MFAQVTSFSNIVAIRVNFMKYANAIDKIQLSMRFHTTFTNFSMQYHLMCMVYTDVGGIK